MGAAQAMEFRVAGSELHLRGKVDGYEFALLKDALAEHPGIDTVVFRASPGGDAWTAYRVGERTRAERPEFLYLAFHGTWNASLHELNNPAIRGRVELRD